jgi:hypothetical protein
MNSEVLAQRTAPQRAQPRTTYGVTYTFGPLLFTPPTVITTA